MIDKCCQAAVWLLHACDDSEDSVIYRICDNFCSLFTLLGNEVGELRGNSHSRQTVWTILSIYRTVKDLIVEGLVSIRPDMLAIRLDEMLNDAAMEMKVRLDDSEYDCLSLEAI